MRGKNAGLQDGGAKSSRELGHDGTNSQAAMDKLHAEADLSDGKAASPKDLHHPHIHGGEVAPRSAGKASKDHQDGDGKKGMSAKER